MNGRAFLVILDGLRRDFVTPQLMPRLAAFANEATTFAHHRSMVPSVTRVCSASVATGCWPARHGLEANTMALVEDGTLVVHDAGHPEFLQHKRRVTGRSLAVPTLAERLANHGGVRIFSNVSPGAAYAHDPDGFGHVYHRAGSFGPGRVPLGEPDALEVGADLDGDRATTVRFIAQTVAAHACALSVLWLGHPDTTQHAVALGSPDHIEALRRADAHAGMVMDAARGADDLLIIGSDHGHQTVTGAVDVEEALRAGGVLDGLGARDLAVAPNGTAALIYLSEAARYRAEAIAAFIERQPWSQHVVFGEALGDVGQSADGPLAILVTMAVSEEANRHGVPGAALVAKPRGGKDPGIGFGQHGGLGLREQSPVLMARGRGFSPGERRDEGTSLVDLAPTILAHLRRPCDGMDGRSLQRS
ncbi:MAG: alkaline phosphatase family protein [Pseudomonadota bacterium]